MKKDWFVIDYQQIKNSEYISSVSHPTKSAELASFADFIVKPELPKVIIISCDVVYISVQGGSNLLSL